MQTITITVTDRQFGCLTLAAQFKQIPSLTQPGYPYGIEDVLMEKISQVENVWGGKFDSSNPAIAEANALSGALQSALNSVQQAQNLASQVAASGSENATVAQQISTTLQTVIDSTAPAVATISAGSQIVAPVL